MGPTYQNIKDSTEVILLEYDPNVVELKEILLEWSRQHSPFQLAYSNQYRSAIFFSDEEERRIAEDFCEELSAMYNGIKVYARVEPINSFYQAEEYHQHYLAKAMGRFAI